MEAVFSTTRSIIGSLAAPLGAEPAVPLQGGKAGGEMRLTSFLVPLVIAGVLCFGLAKGKMRTAPK